MPNIVIIGGGPAGLGVALALQKSKPALPADYNIVLIDRREYYWHLIAGLRAPLDAQIQEQATIPFDRVFKAGSNGRVCKADAKRIDAGFVYTDAVGQDAQIPYKYLVVATGQKWSDELTLPNGRAEAIKQLASQGEATAAAKKILIVGGGAVGVELAGEIALKYNGQKAKQVTLLHRGAGLLNDVYPDKLRNNLKSQLESAGVDVKLGASVVERASSTSVKLATGDVLSADLVLYTIGGQPNNDLVKEFDASTLSPTGSVKVNDRFQMAAHANIFVVGDLADLAEQKQAAKAPGHVSVAVSNIVALAHDQNLSSAATTYKPPKELILVTVGKSGGAGWMFGINVGSWITSMIKSKSLFIAPTRKTLGY